MLLARRPIIVRHASPGQFKVPTPLCQRAPVHEVLLSDLRSWERSAMNEVAQIGDRLLLKDGGPSESDLGREVTWLLEDSVAEVKEAPSSSWSPCTWRNLDSMTRGVKLGSPTLALEGPMVKSRASLSELYTLWRRRVGERAPFQYLVGAAHWLDLVLAVSEGVLIPRPETEIFPQLVEMALRRRPELADLPWADLGTGSGAIAISASRVLMAKAQGRAGRKLGEATRGGVRREEDTVMWAVDLSPVAVAHARRNSLQYVGDAVRVIQGSWCDPLPLFLRGRVGGILSNPPYIPTSQMEGLQHEVGEHEPHLALDGGVGPGTDSLTVICQQAGEMLAPGGFLALETAGNDQALAVRDLLQALGSFDEVEVVDDCYKVPRFVTALMKYT